jgi:hypothetical protein
VQTVQNFETPGPLRFAARQQGASPNGAAIHFEKAKAKAKRSAAKNRPHNYFLTDQAKA